MIYIYIIFGAYFREVKLNKFIKLITPIVLGSSVLAANVAEARPDEFDISYIWTPNLEGALGHMSRVSECLGPSVTKDLRVVKSIKNDNFAIIYDRNTKDYSRAEKTRDGHIKTLRKCDVSGGAAIVEDIGYFDLYNISYGVGPNLDVLKKNFDVISTVLGSELQKDLVIEKRNGNYALVYKRYGDVDSTKEQAQRHKKLLKSKKIDASYTPEKNHDIIYDESKLVHEEIEKTRIIVPEKKIVKVEKPKVVHSNLEDTIEDYIKTMRKRGVLRSDEETSWVIYDFSTGQKLVSINEDIPRQCASMFKPYIMLAYFHEVSKGRQKYNKSTKRKLINMIANSSNIETNRFMKRLGGPAKINKILKANYGTILEDTKIVEYIPKGGRTYRNFSSAHDYSRFLYAMWNGNLPYSKDMRSIMNDVGNGKVKDRIYWRAKEVPSGTAVYDKTGTTGHLVGNIGILVPKIKGERRPYIIVGIIQKRNKAKNFTGWKDVRGNIIRNVSNKAYLEIEDIHD
ncbi:serine hydrolase [Nanoarchaeota archaeon]